MPDTQTKICGQCGTEHPLTEFRRMRRGEAERATQCRECHNRNARVYRAKKRARDIVVFNRQLRDARDSLKVQALASGMIGKFGGVNRLVETWHAEFEAAPEGSKLRFQILQAVTRLAEVVQRSRRR